MTHLEPEDILRRALREAAGSVEPAADGLSQIRARLSAPRPLLVAWLVAAWETVSQFVMLRLEPALAEIGPRLSTALRAADTRLEPVTERLRPAFGWLIAAVIWLRRMIKPQASEHGRPSRYGWVRPVIAMAVVVLVAVVGGFAMSGLPSQIARDGLNVFSGSTSGSGGGGGHTAGVTGGGKHYQQPSSGTSSTSGVTGPTPTPTASRSPKPKSTTSPKPTATPTTSSPSSTSPSPSSPPPTSPPPSSPPPSAGPTPTPSPSDGSQSAS